MLPPLRFRVQGVLPSSFEWRPKKIISQKHHLIKCCTPCVACCKRYFIVYMMVFFPLLKAEFCGYMANSFPLESGLNHTMVDYLTSFGDFRIQTVAPHGIWGHESEGVEYIWMHIRRFRQRYKKNVSTQHQNYANFMLVLHIKFQKKKIKVCGCNK